MKRVLLVAVFVVCIAVVVGLGVGMLKSKWEQPLVNRASGAVLRSEIVDEEVLKTSLDTWGFFDQTEWQVPGGPLLKGKVDNIQVEVTTEPQPYNREDTPQGPVGSVNVKLEGMTMKIIIQTSQSVWGRVDKNWHVESQLLRVVNDMAPSDRKKSARQIVSSYLRKDRMVVVYDE